MVFQPLISWKLNSTVGKDLISVKLDMMLNHEESVKKAIMIKSRPYVGPHTDGRKKLRHPEKYF